MRHTLAFYLFVTLCVASSPAALAITTWYVNGGTGNDSNNCRSSQTACKTIGHAIALASSGDSIMVAAATYKENLTISFSLTITGVSPSTTMVDGGGGNTVVTVSNTSGLVTLSNLTIRNGFQPSGGGIYNSGTLLISGSVVSGNFAWYWGGGIYNSGTLTLTNSTISGNTVSRTCLFCQSFGGGIYNYNGVLRISNSTISANIAAQYHCARCRGGGGGIYNVGGTVVLSNSTLSGNSVIVTCSGTCSLPSEGGGIWTNGALTVVNTTLGGNTASGTNAGLGGGIFHYANEGSVTLQNSIVANSPAGGNCNGTMTSNGYNLSSDNSCNFSNSGDRNNIDPKLEPLQNNGGPTQTMALPSGSPAIDAGNPSGCKDSQGHLLITDQRGMPRPDNEDKTGCDMGAYERQTD